MHLQSGNENIDLYLFYDFALHVYCGATISTLTRPIRLNGQVALTMVLAETVIPKTSRFPCTYNVETRTLISIQRNPICLFNVIDILAHNSMTIWILNNPEGWRFG